MKQDDYGTALHDTLVAAVEPMTASELRDAVGCSRQRVYTWLQANAGHLDEAGKDRVGGQRYVWRDDTTGATSVVGVVVGPTTAATATRGATGDGMTMRVSTVLVDHGEMVLVLIGPDGSVYHARPAAATD